MCGPTGTRGDVTQTLPNADDICKILVTEIDQQRYQFSGRALPYYRLTILKFNTRGSWHLDYETYRFSETRLPYLLGVDQDLCMKLLNGGSI